MTQNADTSLTGFYKVMTPKEKKTFWGCFLGWALDGMDFMIYPLVIGTIISLWQVDNFISFCCGRLVGWISCRPYWAR